jgi:hypothetical protein
MCSELKRCSAPPVPERLAASRPPGSCDGPFASVLRPQGGGVRVWRNTPEERKMKVLSWEDSVPRPQFFALAGGGFLGTSMAHLRVRGLRTFELCNNVEAPR